MEGNSLGPPGGQVQCGTWRLPIEKFRVAVCNMTKQAEKGHLSGMHIQEEMTKNQ